MRLLVAAVATVALLVAAAACKDKEPPQARPPATADAAAAAVTADAAIAAVTADAPPPPPVAPDAAGDTWTEYPVGAGRVRAPVAPTQNTIDIPSDTGTLPATQYTFAPGGDAMLAVLVLAFPPNPGKDVATMLTDNRDGMVESYGGAVSQDRAITIDGAPGRDFTFGGTMPDIGPFHCRARVVIRDSTSYQIAYLRAGPAVELDALGNRFVESFHFPAP